MKKRVYIGMTADVMHPGLVNVIKEGVKYGDVIIGLLTDHAIAEYKRLPYLNYEQRKSVLENIKGVTEVVPQDEWNYAPNLLKYKPDFMIHGDDWKIGTQQKYRELAFEAMKTFGGKIIEVPYTKDISSSEFVESINAIGTTPQIRLKSLRRLISAKPIVRILECHSGLAGLIAEKTNVEVEGKRME
ncbi:MAG: phosphoenolpyruvate phosphomutase, partial [Draconibacterium sp.]